MRLSWRRDERCRVKIATSWREERKEEEVPEVVAAEVAEAATSQADAGNPRETRIHVAEDQPPR